MASRSQFGGSKAVLLLFAIVKPRDIGQLDINRIPFLGTVAFHRPHSAYLLDLSHDAIFGILHRHHRIADFALEILLPQRLAGAELLQAKGKVGDGFGDVQLVTYQLDPRSRRQPIRRVRLTTGIGARLAAALGEGTGADGIGSDIVGTIRGWNLTDSKVLRRWGYVGATKAHVDV